MSTGGALSRASQMPTCFPQDEVFAPGFHWAHSLLSLFLPTGACRFLFCADVRVWTRTSVLGPLLAGPGMVREMVEV